jgi:predicted nucleotidyltransferase
MSTGTPEISAKTAEYVCVLREHLPELREGYGVESLGIFGSHVRGEEREGSDLDVLIEIDHARPFGFFAFLELEEHLSRLLGVQVDLVMRRALKRRIGKHILNEVVRV